MYVRAAALALPLLAAAPAQAADPILVDVDEIEDVLGSLIDVRDGELWVVDGLVVISNDKVTVAHGLVVITDDMITMAGGALKITDERIAIGGKGGIVIENGRVYIAGFTMPEIFDAEGVPA